MSNRNISTVTFRMNSNHLSSISTTLWNAATATIIDLTPPLEVDTRNLHSPSEVDWEEEEKDQKDRLVFESVKSKRRLRF